MATTIKKVTVASEVWGGGYNYTPAKYGVFVDGKKVGLIYGESRGYMDSSRLWELLDIASGRTIFCNPKFSRVKELALAHEWKA